MTLLILSLNISQDSDNLRSIGNCTDGLKVLKKVLFTCFKRNYIQKYKVSHNWQVLLVKYRVITMVKLSLQDIIGMAQNFVGSNNINLLMPNGQFGTRIMGGSDAAVQGIFTHN